MSRDTTEFSNLSSVDTSTTDTIFCAQDTIIIEVPGGFPITSYSWFISSDGEYVNGTDSTSVNPQYLFYECGIHLVELTATDSLGCSHTYIDTVTIYQLPVANFYTDDICDGDSTCIYDLSESNTTNDGCYGHPLES